tara:strand:- start:916 stop:1983 length:1068 start_codon:yes stop_codon:yes gene_type:complete
MYIKEDGLKVFFEELDSKYSTLVLTNYIWYRPYSWHLEQLDKNLVKGNVNLINFAEIQRKRNKAMTFLNEFKLFLRYVSKHNVILIDGYVNFWIYILIIFGFFHKKYLILASQNYESLEISFKSILKYIFLKLAYLRADKIFICCNTSKKLFESYFGKNISKKFVVYYSAINFENTTNYLPASRISEDYILSCGQAGRDYETLSKSLKNFPKETIINCPKKVFDSYSWNNNVTYKENMPVSDLLMLISKCRFLVLPLQNRLEASGLRILYWGLEMGKAIIISNTLSIEDIFSEDAPFLRVPCDDPNALSQTMIDLDNDNDKIRILGEKARKWSKNNLLSSDHVNKIWKEQVNNIV